MKYIVTLNNKEYEVEVSKDTAVVNGVKAVGEKPAAVEAAPAKMAPKPSQGKEISPSTTVADGTVISAPMPGTIMKILKSVGDSVKNGEAVVILEAMKMENEIYSTCDGVVTQIATNGASVNNGDMLVVIK